MGSNCGPDKRPSRISSDFQNKKKKIVVSWPDLVKDLVLPQLKSENDLNFKFSRFRFLGFAASLDLAH